MTGIFAFSKRQTVIEVLEKEQGDTLVRQLNCVTLQDMPQLLFPMSQHNALYMRNRFC